MGKLYNIDTHNMVKGFPSCLYFLNRFLKSLLNSKIKTVLTIFVFNIKETAILFHGWLDYLPDYNCWKTSYTDPHIRVSFFNPQ